MWFPDVVWLKRVNVCAQAGCWKAYTCYVTYRFFTARFSRGAEIAFILAFGEVPINAQMWRDPNDDQGIFWTPLHMCDGQYTRTRSMIKKINQQGYLSECDEIGVSRLVSMHESQPDKETTHSFRAKRNFKGCEFIWYVWRFCVFSHSRRFDDVCVSVCVCVRPLLLEWPIDFIVYTIVVYGFYGQQNRCRRFTFPNGLRPGHVNVYCWTERHLALPYIHRAKV